MIPTAIVVVVIDIVVVVVTTTVAAFVVVAIIIIRASTTATTSILILSGLSCTAGGTLPPTPEWFETGRYSNEELFRIIFQVC